MELWITRQADRGLLLEEYASPEEIEESLEGLEHYDKFSPKEEVKVEITAPWEEVKQLFQDLQRLSDYAMAAYPRNPGIIEIARRLTEQRLIK